MALTGRKLKFAAAKLGGFSNKDAAIKAGYSAATASQAGSRLVKDKDVVAHIKANKKDVKKASAAAKDTAQPEYVSPPSNPLTGYTDPLAFLQAVWTGEVEANNGQIRAAQAALPFTHQKLGEGGKKDAQKDAAKKAGGGRFASAAPPKLVAAGGKKV